MAGPLGIALVVLLLGAMIGGFSYAYVNRPILDDTLAGDGLLCPVGLGGKLQVHFRAENTGQTDLILAVTLHAVNASISSDAKGPYNSSTVEFFIAKARSGWGDYGMWYVVPDQKVTSFSIDIDMVEPQHECPPGDVSSCISSFIVYFTEQHPLYPQVLVYSIDTSRNCYVLQK